MKANVKEKRKKKELIITIINRGRKISPAFRPGRELSNKMENLHRNPRNAVVVDKKLMASAATLTLEQAGEGLEAGLEAAADLGEVVADAAKRRGGGRGRGGGIGRGKRRGRGEEGGDATELAADGPAENGEVVADAVGG